MWPWFSVLLTARDATPVVFNSQLISYLDDFRGDIRGGRFILWRSSVLASDCYVD